MLSISFVPIYWQKIVFFEDHQVVLYLVNKPCSNGNIVRQFTILLEFDFIVVIEKDTTHQRVDHLSCLTHGEPPKGIDDALQIPIYLILR